MDQIFGFLDNADQVFLQLCHISHQLSFLCSGKLDLEMTSFIRASDIAVKQEPAADSISVRTRILGLLYSVCELDAHSVSGNDHTMSFFPIGHMN